MGLHQFRLVVDRCPDRDQLGALHARCGDLTVERDPGGSRALVGFDRTAPTLVDAVVSAVRDLDAVGLAASAAREDDDLVTIGVIAERAGRSREAVRLWSLGRTGPGDFPPPADDSLGTPFYRWSDVLAWLRDRLSYQIPDPEPALTAINLALQLRGLAPRLSRMDAVRSLLAG